MKRMMALLALVAICAAQDAPAGPAKELAKLDVMLGNWEGSGNAMMGPGAPPAPWTAVATVKKILGGYFVQEDMRVDIGPGMPSLVFRTLHAWDPHTKRFVHFAMSNQGNSNHGVTYVAGDGKFVSSSTTLSMGEVQTERSVSMFTKDKWTFEMDQAKGGGKFARAVEGSFKRGGKGFDADGSGAMTMVPPPKEIAEEKMQVGDWSMKGWYVMPGGPKMSFAGSETVKAVLGGHAYMAHMKIGMGPDMPPMLGHAYYLWNAAEKCYLRVSASSMGEFHVSKGYKMGETKAVYLDAGVMRGTPGVGRTVVTWDKEGNNVKVSSHNTTGDTAPVHAFEIELTRVAQVKEKPEGGG